MLATTVIKQCIAVGGTVSQARLDREQLLDDTGSLTVEITEELFASDHDNNDDVATAPYEEEYFLSSEEEPEEPKKKRKNEKNSSDEWEPSDKEDSEIVMEFSSDSSEDLETVGSSDLTEGAKAATSQTDREEDGKLVWWCDECGAEPEVTCTTRRHKMLYACALCVGEGEQAVGFDQFYMRFDDLSSLKVNVQLEHNTKVCQRALCPDCGRYHFKKDHVCAHKIKKIPCLDCGKLFTSQTSLKLHIRVHQDSFVHACKFCLKKFKTKPDKQTHEESHPQEKSPYQCPDCSERFSTFKKRNGHLQTCRGPRRYICDVCGQELNGLNALNRHKMVHTGQKPYKCKVCHMSFNQVSHLKSHMRLHTGERPFNCQQCEKCFNHNVSLKNHVHLHHGPESQEQGEREKKLKSQELNSGAEEKEQGGCSSPKERGEGQEPIHQPEQEREKREPRNKSSQRLTTDPEDLVEEGVRQINSDSDFNPTEERTTSRGRGRGKGRPGGRPSTNGKRNVAEEDLE
ncbi:zinc finger protein 98-like isoform X2 [Salvelinus alpinus]|uniref:zinc finger protein 98-like isoform X2 n=1 Tax=Salvelinus alpinus TaxID=8036 RepID=UPI0039FD36BC